MTDTFELSCPDCGLSRPANSDFIGRRVKCSCGNVFAVEDSGAVEFEQFAHMRNDVAPAIQSSQPTVAMAQRKRTVNGRIRAIGMAAFVGSSVLVYAMFLRPSPDGELVIPQADGVGVLEQLFAKDEAHDWVESWLAENTPTGEWEELRWSGTMPVKGHNLKVATIKYRTENNFGAKSVFRQHFVHGPDGWYAFDVPSKVVAHDPELFEKLRVIRAIVMALDPSEIPLIGRYGTDHHYVQHVLKYSLRDDSEPEPADPNGLAVLKELE